MVVAAFPTSLYNIHKAMGADKVPRPTPTVKSVPPSQLRSSTVSPGSGTRSTARNRLLDPKSVRGTFRTTRGRRGKSTGRAHVHTKKKRGARVLFLTCNNFSSFAAQEVNRQLYTWPLHTDTATETFGVSRFDDARTNDTNSEVDCCTMQSEIWRYRYLECR